MEILLNTKERVNVVLTSNSKTGILLRNVTNLKTVVNTVAQRFLIKL